MCECVSPKLGTLLEMRGTVDFLAARANRHRLKRIIQILSWLVASLPAIFLESNAAGCGARTEQIG